jgi:hypothetical protein
MPYFEAKTIKIGRNTEGVTHKTYPFKSLSNFKPSFMLLLNQN